MWKLAEHLFCQCNLKEKGKVRIDQKLCRACGRCVDVCKQNAIQIEIQNSDFIKDSIKKISSEGRCKLERILENLFVARRLR